MDPSVCLVLAPLLPVQDHFLSLDSTGPFINFISKHHFIMPVGYRIHVSSEECWRLCRSCQSSQFYTGLHDHLKAQYPRECLGRCRGRCGSELQNAPSTDEVNSAYRTASANHNPCLLFGRLFVQEPKPEALQELLRRLSGISGHTGLKQRFFICNVYSCVSFITFHSRSRRMAYFELVISLTPKRSLVLIFSSRVPLDSACYPD
jgi:hypothetical protein